MRQFLPYENGIASPKTFWRVFDFTAQVGNQMPEANSFLDKTWGHKVVVSKQFSQIQSPDAPKPCKILELRLGDEIRVQLGLPAVQGPIACPSSLR